MSSVVIAGDTSGSVSLEAPAVAGTTVLTLPATSGTVLAPTGGTLAATQGGTGLTSVGSAGNTLFTTDGSTWSSTAKIVRATAQSLTGSAVTFSGIPNWVKRITVMFINIASSSPSTHEIRLGTSGGIVATGYNSAGASAGNNSSGATYSTTGFAIRSAAVSGQMIINNISGNIWTESYCARETATYADWGGGDVTLSGTVTQLSINAISGTFSAGTVNIIYE